MQQIDFTEMERDLQARAELKALFEEKLLGTPREFLDQFTFPKLCNLVKAGEKATVIVAAHLLGMSESINKPYLMSEKNDKISIYRQAKVYISLFWDFDHTWMTVLNTYVAAKQPREPIYDYFRYLGQ